jgi:hypothetical protein
MQKFVEPLIGNIHLHYQKHILQLVLNVLNYKSNNVEEIYCEIVLIVAINVSL